MSWLFSRRIRLTQKHLVSRDVKNDKKSIILYRVIEIIYIFLFVKILWEIVIQACLMICIIFCKDFKSHQVHTSDLLCLEKIEI